MVVLGFEVPLLSREGLPRRLLAGAAAPWSPALNPVSKFPAIARFVLKFPAAARFVFVDDKTAALAAAL